MMYVHLYRKCMYVSYKYAIYLLSYQLYDISPEVVYIFIPMIAYSFDKSWRWIGFTTCTDCGLDPIAMSFAGRFFWWKPI